MKYNQVEYNKKYQKNIRLAVIAMLGGVCIRCGFFDVRALQIDHVNGGGNKEMREANGNYYKVLRDFLNNPTDNKYQLLCANCNWIKKYEKLEHPYKLK